MSVVEQLREVMSTAYDLVKDYDSDNASETSSSAHSDPYYTANCIIAEDLEQEECYLVSWEGYPLDDNNTTDQLPGTWEPPPHLDGSDLIKNWAQVKKELGKAAFVHENKKNRKSFEQAQKKAQAAKARRLAQRRRLRQDLHQRNRSVVFDDDSSDDTHSPPARSGDSLFVDSQPPSISTLSLGSSSRRPPLQQSSSEDDATSDTSSPGDTLNTLKRKKDLPKANQSAAKRQKGSLTQQQKKQPDTAASAATMVAPTSSETPSQKPNASAVPTTQKGAVRSEDSEIAKSSKPAPMRAIRTMPQGQSSKAIKFIDQPAEKQRREWSSEKQYSRLRFRALAEKRSRKEAAPDFSALNFVNGPPPTLPKAAASSSVSDPYGRRDITSRRVQEEDQDDRPRRGLTDDVAALADWETDKVPLICFHWYSSSNCPYGPQKCRFLHRKTDPDGRPYMIGDYEGRVPHKYRKPPITCPFWYKGKRCRKTAEECLYAHEDTGWAEVNGVPVRIEHLPPEPSVSNAQDSSYLPPKLQAPPITCSFWLRDFNGCIRSDEACNYAHWNTGWAHPEANIKAPPERIDSNMKPRGRRPKYANPPVTCPFWLRSFRGCTRTDEECKYAHWNTGWAPPGMTSGEAVPIDPRELPRNPSLENEPIIEVSAPFNDNQASSGKQLTCPMWLRDPSSCPNPEESCSYAHRNTGLATPKGRPFDPPVPLDPNQIPRSAHDRAGSKLEPKYANPPVTCSSWLRNDDGCPKKDESCRFAHKNTGWLPQHGEGGGPIVKIDHTEKPRYTGPDQGSTSPYPSLTCYYWMKGKEGCTKTSEDCSFAHRNTGWIKLVGDSTPQKINPNLQPRFRKYDPTETYASQNSTVDLPTRTTSSRSTDMSATHSPHHTSAGTMIDIVPAPDVQHVHSLLQMQNGRQNAIAAVPTCSQLGSKIASFWNLSIAKIFNSGIPGDNDPLERQAMLLYHPNEHTQETELITRWLLMYSVKVASLWYDGAWDKFREDIAKHKSGIIIAHPDFEHYCELPGFGDVLKQRVRVWSVGLQSPAHYESCIDPNPPELRHDCVNIFPHGGFIYITDDVFEQKPQLALRIVKLFFAKIEQLRSLDGPTSPWLEVYDACLLWRLCVRPELMEYLYLKCEGNLAEIQAGDPDHLSRVELYELLTLTNYIDQDHPLEPLSLVEDQHPILSLRREMAELPPLNYFNRLKENQEDANTRMIGYYAALQSADMRHAYRHLYVVHTEPEVAVAQQWKTKIHNIADVLTPAQCIEELSKPSKESMFEFLDWAMSPKQEDLGTGAEEGEICDVVVEDTRSRKEIHEVEHTAY